MGVIYMKILNFGSLNIDYVYSVDHFVQKGETISSSQMNIFSGGKGLNFSNLKDWNEDLQELKKPPPEYMNRQQTVIQMM